MTVAITEPQRKAWLLDLLGHDTFQSLFTYTDEAEQNTDAFAAALATMPDDQVRAELHITDSDTLRDLRTLQAKCGYGEQVTR